MSEPDIDQETVDSIVDVAESKCFDWAQSSGTDIADTMAAVAARLAVQAVTIKHEMMVENMS